MITVKKTTEEKNEPKPFPKLMKSDYDDMIVLFTEPSIGTIIWASKTYEIGRTSRDFQIKAFTDYNEPITIQNA